MKLMSLRSILLFAMLALTLVTAALFAVFMYQTRKSLLLHNIDQRLRTAVLFTRAVLPDDYHDRITGPASVPDAQYHAIVTSYNQLCRDLDLQYLWSVMQVDGKIVFTSGTATSKDIRKGDYARFYEEHTDPGSFAHVLTTMQDDYSSFRNKWGLGRMVLIPDRDRHGRPVIYGASVSLAEVEHLLNTTLAFSLLASLGVVLIGIILSFSLSNMLARPLAKLTDSAKRIAAGADITPFPVDGGLEIASLSQSIASMHQEIVRQLDELQTSRDDLLITLDSIGDGVIAMDTEGRITRINRTAQLLTGWSEREAVGHALSKVFNVVNSRTRESVVNPVERVLRDGAVVGVANDTLLIARDGAERQIADSAAPISHCAGSDIKGVVLVFRDITENNRLEAQVRQAQKMESVGRLAGGIAHDFNNMLCGISGYAGVLQESLAGDPKLSGHVRHIQEAAGRAASLTQKLLAFSRQGSTTMAPIDMHTMVREMLAIFTSGVDRRIEMTLELNAGMVTILGDSSQVQHALLNLCLNARDAMPAGGTLTIATRNVMLNQGDCRAGGILPGSYLQVTIMDTGQGIPEDIREKIFDPFFTTKEVGAGIGLGLAGVYATMKEHHGAIIVVSEVGHGATFQLFFPVTAQEAPIRTASSRPLTHGSGTILFVDDERSLRELGDQVLSELGYTVLLATNGEEALAIYRKHRATIDLVVLDVVMPKMSGPDTFYALRTLNPSVKVVLSSGFTRDTNIDDMLSEGIISFLQKPYDLPTLSETIADAITAEPWERQPV
ncbi:MAG: hybrid sensor histidine kinase/response regulator [Armatimonadota bacterium]